MNSVLLASGADDWATPKTLFDVLNTEFGFTIDVCAVEWNAKLPRYWSPKEDALLQNWGGGKFVS